MSENQDGDKGFNPLFVVGWTDGLLGRIQAKLDQKFYEASARWLARCGHYSLLAAALLGFVFGVVLAIKRNDLSTFMLTLGWVFLIAVIQYTSTRFLFADDVLIRTSPTRLSSRSFLECMALLSLIGGIVALVWLTAVAIREEAISPFWTGLALFISLEFLGILSLQHPMLNIAINPGAGAGEEAIGVLSFFLKALLRLVPIVFGAGVTIGAVYLLIADYNLLRGSDFMDRAMFSGTAAATAIIAAGLFPLGSFIAFLMGYLGIDVIRAILSLPEKVDRVAASRQ